MASAVQRAATERAASVLSAWERNLLKMHGRGGIRMAADYARLSEAETREVLAKIKAKLEPVIARELKRPAEEERVGSSLGPPERVHSPPSLALRSNGLLLASTPKRKVGNYREKDCSICGKPFKPKAARQVKCDECRGIAPVKVRHEPPAPAPVPEKPIEESLLDAAGVEPPSPRRAPPPAPLTPAPRPPKPARPVVDAAPAQEYVRLRDELTAIQARLYTFATGLDRLMENRQQSRANGEQDAP